MKTPSKPTYLRYDLEVGDVDEARPLIYLWEALDSAGQATFQYIGKSVNGASRPRTAYRSNVNRLLAGKPYRKSKPDGYRVVHRRLAEAVRDGDEITLRLLANVSPDEDIFAVERSWQERFAIEPVAGDLDADSIEQRIAEAHILAMVGNGLGVVLQPANRNGMSFDGFLEEPPILVEVWAHQGLPKPAQKNKVMTDALKLVHGDRELFDGKATKILAMASDEAAKPFRSGTWMASALGAFGVELRIVALSREEIDRLVMAQKRQAQGNR